MSFIIYKKIKKNGFYEFEYIEETDCLPSAIRSYVQERYKESKETPLRWHIREEEFLKRIGYSSDDFAFIIDTEPKNGKYVCLYHLKNIWGFSVEDWTPIALGLESLFVDRFVKDPKDFKRKFDDRNCERLRVYEFLYLRGGTEKGKWTWGRVGYVNAVLLFEHIWRYFNEELNKDLEG